MDLVLNDNKEQKQLSTLESFFQFDDTKLNEEQKEWHSIIAIIITVVWLALSLFGVALGLIWIIVLSTILFKIIKIGLKSSKRWLAFLSIFLYIINILYYILAIFLTIVNA